MSISNLARTSTLGEPPPNIEELTGAGSEFTTPTKYDPAIKARAYQLYLNSDLDTTDIALDLAIPRATVTAWAAAGKWRDRKQEIENELMLQAEDSYRQVIIKNRKPVLERHLRVSGKLEEAIEKVLDAAMKDDGIPSDVKLKRLAEALASVTGISARAAAINDKPFEGLHQAKSKTGDRRAPLILVQGGTVTIPPGSADD